MKSYSKHERMKDLLFYCLIFCISLGICAVAFSYPQSSSVFPRILGIVLMCISAVSAIVTWRKKALNQDCEKSEQEKSHNSSKTKTPILFFILVALYLFALTKIGFFVSTYFFVVLAMFVLNYRNKVILFIWPLILCATIWLAFSLFLKVPTPEGILF